MITEVNIIGILGLKKSSGIKWDICAKLKGICAPYLMLYFNHSLS